METITTHGVNGAARESTGLIESLVERIGGRARTATIYGDPVERDGVTVVPVARAMWGCGGGAGRDDEQQMGSGEGGGMLLTPVGYIGIQGGSSSFRPIFRPPIGAIGLVVGICSAWPSPAWPVCVAARRRGSGRQTRQAGAGATRGFQLECGHRRRGDARTPRCVTGRSPSATVRDRLTPYRRGRG